MQDIVFQSAAASVRARGRIRNLIYETPLIPARMAAGTTAKLFFKAENFQHTGSFKIRGAAAKMTACAPGQKLVTASSGNHGIGAACAAQILQHDLTVTLPENVVAAKLEKIRSYGVNVVLHGAETGLAELYAQHLAAEKGYCYISPYNDPDIIAGQGTIGLELLEQAAAGIDVVYIAMGGGGLISGIAAVFKSFSPKTRIVGVAAENSQALALSMAAGKVVETTHLATLADAVAGSIDDDTITLALALAGVDDVITCNEAEIAEGLCHLAFGENMLVEGAAALAFAGYRKEAHKLKNQTAIVLLCGANYDEACLRQVLSTK